MFVVDAEEYEETVVCSKIVPEVAEECVDDDGVKEVVEDRLVDLYIVGREVSPLPSVVLVVSAVV